MGESNTTFKGDDSTTVGWIWLIVGGCVAFGFSAALYLTDEFLSNSRREVILGETLHELRTAQTSLPSRVTDTRQFDLAPRELKQQ